MIASKKTGKSISSFVLKSVPHNLFKEYEWYSREEVNDKLEDLNPLYTMSNQTFLYWMKKLYAGTFKKHSNTTLYQGAHLNPVIDVLIAFKKG